MKPRFNLWIEAEGEVVLSRWRVRLLEAIQDTGSITAAAELLDVPYRRAWERIQEMETRLQLDLIHTEVGGSTGGGAELTGAAKKLIEQFDKFSRGLEEEIQARFQQAFPG